MGWQLRVALVLFLLVPLLVAYGLLVVVVLRDQRAAGERGLMDTVRGLSWAVEETLGRSVGALQALADSPLLDDPVDVQRFSEAVRRVSTSQAWSRVWLLNRAGEHVVGLSRPLATPPPSLADRDYFQRVVQTHTPQVSDLVAGPTGGELSLAVAVPVFRDGTLKYVLAAGLDPSTFSAVLMKRELPPSGIASMIDRNKRFIATTRSPEQLIGSPAIARSAGKTAELEAGVLRTHLLDAEELYTAFKRVPLSGWTVLLGVPVETVVGPVRRSLWAFVGGGLILALLIIGAAMVTERRIVVPTGERVGAGSLDVVDRARRWVEEGENHIRVMRGILEDYDRLHRMASDAEQESERLRNRLATAERQCEELGAEVSRLRAEVERYQREREETRAVLAQIVQLSLRLLGEIHEAGGAAS